MIPVTIFSGFSLSTEEVIKERTQAEWAFGAAKEKEILNSSVEAYRTIFSPIAEGLSSFYITEEEGIFDEETKIIIDSIFGSVFQAIHRFFVMIEWSIWFIPVILLSAVDAFSQRRIRSENLTWQSPIKYHLGIHGVIFAIGASWTYVLFPLSVTVVAMPLFFVALSYFLYMSISNLQRML